MFAVIFTVLLRKLSGYLQKSAFPMFFLTQCAEMLFCKAAFPLIFILIKSQISPTLFQLISFCPKLGSPASVLLIVNSSGYQTIFCSFDLGRSGAVFHFFSGSTELFFLNLFSLSFFYLNNLPNIFLDSSLWKVAWVEVAVACSLKNAFSF